MCIFGRGKIIKANALLSIKDLTYIFDKYNFFLNLWNVPVGGHTILTAKSFISLQLNEILAEKHWQKSPIYFESTG